MMVQRLLNRAMNEPPVMLMVSKWRQVGTFTFVFLPQIPVHGYSIFRFQPGEVYMACHINLALPPPVSAGARHLLVISG